MSATERRIGSLKTGRVVSDSMTRTVVVEVERISAHPLYRRRIRNTKRYLVHDEKEQAHPGDMVTIRECRPISRRKRWWLHEVVRRSAVPDRKPSKETEPKAAKEQQS
ncbi:MAG: 30S ribosomal protein S17 [Acidobacteriota bacterium]|nr:30S ribosomal protein S17 [Acidobacteriota bacterium]